MLMSMLMCPQMTLDQRLQLLLVKQTHVRLVKEARSRGVSVGKLVRTAIDNELEKTGGTQAKASLLEILGGAQIPVPKNPGLLRREIEAGGRKR